MRISNITTANLNTHQSGLNHTKYAVPACKYSEFPIVCKIVDKIIYKAHEIFPPQVMTRHCCVRTTPVKEKSKYDHISDEEVTDSNNGCTCQSQYVPFNTSMTPKNVQQLFVVI